MRAKRKPTNRKEAEWKRITRSAKAIEDDGDRRTPATLKALRSLGVSEQDLSTVPRITDLLRLADGGLKTVVAALRLSPGDETISAFLRRYDSLSPADRACVPWEAVAVAAQINVNIFLGAVLVALQAQAVSLVKILAVTSHPRIIAARIRFGQMPGGSRDRQALDQAMGFLPSPRGPVFVGKAVYNSGKAVMDRQRRCNDDDMLDDEDVTIDEVPIMESDPDLDRLFPPPARMQEKLIPIRNRLYAPESELGTNKVAHLFRQTPKN
jgi:hypothetical protein